MSRLEVRMPAQAQSVIEQIYSSMERRIEANPPGLCPVDMTLNFLSLCQAQTCGKCAPCRIGLDQLSLMIRQFEGGRLMECAAFVSLMILCVNLLVKTTVYILKKVLKKNKAR